MNSNEAIDLAKEAVMLMLVLGAPVLLTGMITGMIVSIMQALTQVQELTLSFVPKIIAMVIAAMITGPWVLERLIEFSRRMFS
ncbi:MAG: flagellar biosynthetic protein FliQ [Planctomycetaceae bacterium]|nr:MAG: flagellar biosynthetic protein FliQ [Planctomycetaceae bacterium]